MSNNNYIAIQLSFLSYILFVFTRFEAFVRNDVEFGYERLASRSCLKRSRPFGYIVMFDVYDDKTVLSCVFNRLIDVANYVFIIFRYIVLQIDNDQRFIHFSPQNLYLPKHSQRIYSI